MMEFILIVTCFILAVLAIAFIVLKARQKRLYEILGTRIKDILVRLEPFEFAYQTEDLPAFEGNYAAIGALLTPASFSRLQADILPLADRGRVSGESEPNYIPTHKQGATIAYQTLIEQAPEVISFYQSSELRDLLSKIIGEKVMPTPINDQSSCSVLLYEQPGDHIDWHYDYNFYHGRHFTVLVPILNQGHQKDGLSAAVYALRDEGVEKSIATPHNSLIMHEGAKVLHKASRIEEGERRILLSMTFGTNPTSNPIKGTIRRIKDIAFFGPRALWT